MSGPMYRAPSLAERWFIDDAVDEIGRLCPMCRDRLRTELRLFGTDDRSALHEIYIQSRAIRVTQFSHCDNWEALRVISTIGDLIEFSKAGYEL